MKSIIEIKIRGYHIDHFNHVNNARYLEFLEDGRWEYSEKNDLIKNFHKKGISHVAVNININYRKSSFQGQVLKIETSVIKKGRSSVTMLQKVFLNSTDTLIADAEVTNVFIDAKTGNLISIDEELMSVWPDLAEIKN